MDRFDKILSQFDEANTRLEKMYSSIAGGGDNLVKLGTIRQIPVYSSYKLDYEVYGWRLPDTSEGHTLVSCNFGLGSFLPRHTHDCYEKFIMMRGEVHCDGKLLKTGERLIYKPLVPHVVSSESGAWCIIEFYQ